MPSRVERVWPVLLWAAGLLLPWCMEHLPLIDLPQHAAQIALLRDMLIGRSAWADLLQINWFTPYFVGYGLGVPLSFVLSPGATVSAILTLGFAVWMWGATAMRRDMGGDPRLDVLFAVSYFGMAFDWGFMTFLLAAGLSWQYLRLARRLAMAPGGRLALQATVLGVCLFFAHGLIFVFCLMATAGYAIEGRRVHNRFDRLVFVPFVVMLAVAIIYFQARVIVDPGNVPDYTSWASVGRRVLGFFAFPLTGAHDLDMVILVVACFALMIMMKLRWNTDAFGWWVLPALVSAIWLACPAYVFKTAMVYERFALFILPAITLSLKAGDTPADWFDRAISKFALPLVGVVFFTAKILGMLAWQPQTQQIDQVLNAIPPQQRVLALIYSVETESGDHLDPLGHYTTWYMARAGGLVDFNFAVWLPQPVRYRVDRYPTPPYEALTNKPETFDCKTQGGADYPYIVVRSPARGAARPLADQGCNVAMVTQHGQWSLYKNHDYRIKAQ